MLYLNQIVKKKKKPQSKAQRNLNELDSNISK